MLSPTQTDWLNATAKAALDAGHIFPQAAACEAALESGYGASELAKNSNNLFGMKQHEVPKFETTRLWTHEFIRGQYAAVEADFVKYPTLADCFADRMDTLRRLSVYAPALAASNDTDFIVNVSEHWSTDPRRAQKVLAIYAEFVA
jgi:flagellum-specific peptidoglycan hydrolase FlgJ